MALNSWHGSPIRDACGRAIGERFDEIVALHKDDIAITTPRRAVSYAELAAISRRIAARIDGVAPQRLPPSPVCILLPQGIDAVAAQLGVLRSGRCYVPLDPRHPVALLERAVRHCAAASIVTTGTLGDLAAKIVGDVHRVVLLDELEDTETGDERRAYPAPDAFAYIYYTSGSTGQPKGVADTHRNVLHNVLRYTRTLGIVPGDRLTLLQSPAFSGAVSSTFGALLNGAMLCPYDLHEDGPENLAAWLADVGATIYHSVPALFRTLVAGRGRYPQMRLVRLEGDRALARDAALFQATFPETSRLVNGLGTTETGIVRQYFVSRNSIVGDGLLPVGHAVPDMDVSVVDSTGNTVGAGEIGEIAVRSRFLALGYWNDATTTAKKFTADPGGGPERVYRTGDLGRMRDDGCLEHLGRRDFVIRMRGHSIDPSEVEHALVAAPGVADAAVAARSREDGSCQLIAFVVAQAGLAPTVDGIRAALRKELPDFMIPSMIAFRDALPLTRHAKLDREAVGELVAALAESPRVPHGSAPKTPLETLIASIWGAVLGREHVGTDVEFLDLGGDSLQAMQVFMRVRERLGIAITLDEFFGISTIAGQAEWVASVAGGVANAGN